MGIISRFVLFVIVLHAAIRTMNTPPSMKPEQVGGEGFEPSRPCGQGILSPLCLPFHHPPG